MNALRNVFDAAYYLVWDARCWLRDSAPVVVMTRSALEASAEQHLMLGLDIAAAGVTRERIEGVRKQERRHLRVV